ncbi:virion structural protein [Cronobacter phage vB_CsaM_GAP32]|uniref:Uncharacterized protein n=1 Tax=Cronobacter phage vB_CsaM_GAP32 TaxID=1141136 RepID=K4F7K7_9CAUD|nr:virion structural protein [Cronobacter phage vB_CsaM_GAP32]AFC21767.1 hypothetical protein GAP32_317 [Cronobacter phage vB_CsaM_GAP32]
MPSKSKAQAHLMAAAAHNPEIAKDAGIPQDVAHDFNQADKKEGTLKKGSDAPEHVTEELINEASGVGILKVPPTLLKQFQRIVCSILLTMGVMRQKELSEAGYSEQVTALNTFLKRYQNKYNASVLSQAAMKKYINSISTVNVDTETVFNELPQSLKNREGVKDSLSNLKLRILLSNQVSGIYGSSQDNHTGSLNIQTIAIPSYYHDFKNRTVEEIANTMSRVPGTVEHELQHAMQNAVLGRLNKHDKQVEQKPGYSDHGDAYYASGVEFGTQVKDLANYAKNWLNENPDELTGSKTKDISSAIKYALSTHKGTIIQALRKYQHDDRANKAMKLIYREVSDFYENEFADQSDSGKLDRTEKDDFEDTDNHARMLEYPEPGDSLLGDLWLSINRYYGESPRVMGYYDDIKELIFKRDYGEIIFEQASNGGAHMYLRVPGNKEKSFHIELRPEDLKSLIPDVAYFTNLQTVHKLKDRIEQDQIPNVNLESAYYDINDVIETEEMFNTDSNKKVSAQYDEEDGNVWVSFNGARQHMYIQEGGKDYFVGYSDGMTRCKQKELRKCFETLISFYFSNKTNTKMINKMLKHITNDQFTVESIKQYADYLNELYEEPVEESSMRSLADIVQNAELEHDIDDANDQELINKGVLDEDADEEQEYDLQGKPVESGQKSAPVNAGTSTERLSEMPLQYDSFMGMDPQVYVDNSARKSPYKNMTPVKDHGEWTTYKGPDGYMAYDNDTGEALAAVEGHEHHGWFNVDVTASSRHVKGVVYQMFMDIVKVEGTPILSGRLQSDDAIKFWKRLIQSHKVFVVANDEVLQQATPEKFHKYWSDEEGSPQSQFQFLLVK